MFKKILVPLDGSELAKQALPVAVTIAQQNQGEIVLVRVPALMKMSVPSGVEGLKLFDEAMAFRSDQCESYLGYIQQAYMDADVPMHKHVVEGDPASVIVDTAVAEDIDLIVMTTHGRTGFRRWVVGSVTEKVMRHAHCPVLAVRDGTIPEDMIITLDGSELAEHSLVPGLSLAHVFDAQATLLCVIEPAIELDAEERAHIRPEDESWLFTVPEVLHQNALDYLEKTATKYEPMLPHIKYAVTTNYAAEGIVDFAERYDMDLIVMTTHGDTGIGRWTYGSVTEKVTWSAPCSMLVIRSL
jgi:nucleotide-binding universal stress UspA family protein